MAHRLKDIVRAKLSETGISAHALEKRAGLKRSSVQNILLGRSKKPSGEILQAIANILECNISEFLDNSKPVSNDKDFKASGTNLPFNSKLYLEAVNNLIELEEKQKISIKQEEAIDFIKEIYTYSLRSQKLTIDKFFVEWLASKRLKIHNKL